MKKLFLVALCSMPLLSVARAEEGQMKSGDAMQQGDATKPGDGMGYGGSMEQDAAKTSGKKAKDAKKKGTETKMQGDGMKHGGSMQHDDQMDQGKTK
jgi:hypothetical protein